MAGFTYATLTTAIQNYCEVDTTVFTSTITDQFIMNAEYRINNDLPMDADRFVDEGTMAADVNNLRDPAGTLFVRGVEVFNASNSTEQGKWLERRDQTFLTEYVGRLTGPSGSTASGVDVTGKPTLTKEEQNTLKKGADIAAGGVGDIKDKKDVPAWALPMMSAGFAMMASKSPYFMQALGEAGQAGVETYTAQKTAEEDKLDKESARELAEAQAAYYRGEGRQTSTKTVVQDGMLYKSDGTPFYITTPEAEKIHAKAS